MIGWILLSSFLLKSATAFLLIGRTFHFQRFVPRTTFWSASTTVSAGALLEDNEIGGQNIYLMSLEWTDETLGRFSQTVRSVWRWKDAVMGDGRDYFIPKPKTVSAYSYILVATNVSSCPTVPDLRLWSSRPRTREKILSNVCHLVSLLKWRYIASVNSNCKCHSIGLELLI